MNCYTRPITVLLLTLSVRAATAQLVFDDGGQHVLQGDVGSVDVFVGNESQLQVEAISGYPTIDVDNGGVEVDGGIVNRIRLNNGQAFVNGFVGIHAADKGVLQTIEAQGSSAIEIRGDAEGIKFGPYPPLDANPTGVTLDDTSILRIDGGLVSGRTAIEASGSSVTTFTNGFAENNPFDFGIGPAVILRDNASFHFSGGELRAAKVTVEMHGASRFEMTGGTLWSESPDEGQSAITLYDDSQAVLSGGETRIRNELIFHKPFPNLFDVRNNAMLTVNSGRYVCDVNITPTCIAGRDDANLIINEGDFRYHVDLFPPDPDADEFSLINVGGHSKTQVNGGEHIAQVTLDNHFYDATAVVRVALTQEDAMLEIRGGDFDVRFVDANQQLPVQHIEATDRSSVTLYGRFNYPSGAIGDLSGTITGTLADGSPIEWNFLREPTATIVVVPEASSGAMALVASLILAARFQRGPCTAKGETN